MSSATLNTTKTTTTTTSKYNEMKMPEDIREQIEEFDKAFTEIDQFIRPLFFTNFKEVQSKLSPIQRAKLNISLAYTVNTLFYMFLKTQGINTKDHPVKKELARIQEYIKKIKTKQAEAHAPSRKIQVNKEASARFIHAVLGNGSKSKHQNQETNEEREEEEDDYENHVKGDNGDDDDDDNNDGNDDDQISEEEILDVQNQKKDLSKTSFKHHHHQKDKKRKRTNTPTPSASLQNLKKRKSPK